MLLKVKTCQLLTKRNWFIAMKHWNFKWEFYLIAKIDSLQKSMPIRSIVHIIFIPDDWQRKDVLESIKIEISQVMLFE